MRFKYCPLCGKKLIPKYSFDEGHVPYCDYDDIMYFDTPTPCVIVAVIKEDKILLLKQSYIFKNSKVLLSGYVTPGESVENSVHREVKEEAGVDICDIRYLGSEYLKEKDIIMLTFMANYKEGVLDKSLEVEWIGWIPLCDAMGEMQEDEIGKRVVKKVLDFKDI